MMHRKRSSSKRSSAAIIGGNDDLLKEILVLLPAKSLIKFQLVSKHWQSLIFNPSFSHLHHSHSLRRRPEPQLSFILGTITLHFFICNPTTKSLVPFRSRLPFVKILQSCNGLLLLKSRQNPHVSNDYYIFNPTTMKYRNLGLYGPFLGLCLMFDPSESQHYRVVCFRSDDHSVYDSKTHSWKNVDQSITGPYKFCDGVYWKDGLYFIRSRESSSFCFFLKDEIRFIPDPPIIQCRGAKKSYIMESYGHMYCIVLSLRPDKNRLYILELNDDESGWFRNYRVNLNPISATIAAQEGADLELLGMVEGEKEEDTFLLFHVPGKILIYRFSDKVFEVLADFRWEYYFQEDRIQFGFKDAHRFIQSLAPV